MARGRILYAQQRYDEAIEYVRLAIARKADCEGAYNILGRSFFASGRFQEAANVAERAVEANGDDYNMYIPYMNALERLGNMEAVARFRESEMQVLEQQLELVPEDVRARILLAADYGYLGREEDAVRHLEMAVTLRPNDSMVLYNAACTYGVLERKAETLEILRRAKEAGYANVDWIRRDPDLACVHDTPEFKALFPVVNGPRNLLVPATKRNEQAVVAAAFRGGRSSFVVNGLGSPEAAPESSTLCHL